MEIVSTKKLRFTEPVVRADSIILRTYQSDEDMKIITAMMERDLSEPYSIFTYRYFLQDWPDLTWLAVDGEKVVGAVVCEMKAPGQVTSL